MPVSAFWCSPEVHHLARLARDPRSELVGRQRILIPSLVREAESYVVREFVVAQQHAQTVVNGIGIDVIGRFPSQNMLGALGQYGLEPQLRHHRADLVGVDELGVAERGGFLAELLLNHGGVQFHLLHEILLRRERSERVRIGLGQKLHASRLGQSAERVEHLGSVGAELLHGRARYRERAAERPLVLLDELQQERIHRQITLARHLLHDRAIGEIVQIVVILADVEESVNLQTPRLVHLKI